MRFPIFGLNVRIKIIFNAGMICAEIILKKERVIYENVE